VSFGGKENRRTPCIEGGSGKFGYRPDEKRISLVELDLMELLIDLAQG
jgi:hypothetical protein